jgi:cytidylate kinase
MEQPSRPFLLGLTGGIACGKSLAAAQLQQLGAVVIDADQVTHRLQQPGTAVFAAIVDAFGPTVIAADGSLDRRALGALVFGDPAQLQRLEAIVHPAVRAAIEAAIAAVPPYRDGRRSVAVVDAIKLIESGWAARCDAVWVVTAPPDQQLQRLMQTRGLSEIEARARIDAQVDQRSRLKFADMLLENHSTRDALIAQVTAAWQALPIADERAVVSQVPQTIAIDGPAGAGKSTLGALLAEQLGYLYFDTGVMYRALALAAIERSIDRTDEAAVARLATVLQIDVLTPTVADGRQYTVLADGDDVTWELRRADVEQAVSQVARYPTVRRELVQRQQQIGRRGRVVMVGRDIGTIVMPDADLKLYLQTSLDERARRRAVDNAAPPERVAADLARRDALDSHVLQPADDAVILQTDDLTPADELQWVLKLIGGAAAG